MSRSFSAGSYTFDDFAQGDRFVTPGASMTEAQIVDFALMFDPQPFHIDREAAARSMYGGIIASGFHTLSFCFRLVMAAGVLNDCNLGGNQLDEVKFLKPVKPSDTLRVECTFEQLRVSASKPSMGIAKIRYRASNQQGEEVLSLLVTHLIKRRATD